MYKKDQWNVQITNHKNPIDKINEIYILLRKCTNNLTLKICERNVANPLRPTK